MLAVLTAAAVMGTGSLQPSSVWGEAGAREGIASLDEEEVYREEMEGDFELETEDSPDSETVPEEGLPDEMAGTDAGAAAGEVWGSPAGAGGVQTSDEEPVLHQPKLTLESWKITDDQPLLAGETREGVAVFRNQSRDRAVYNLEISLEWEAQGLGFGKTSYYYPSAAAGAALEVPVTIRVSSGAEQQDAVLRFSLEYEDDKGTACTGSEKVILDIRQKAEVQVSGFFMEEQVCATDTLSKDIKVQNTGKAPVYNVQVTVEGSGIFARSPLFAGNLEAGGQAEGTLLLYVGTRDMKEPGTAGEGTEEEKYGETRGTLLLTYEDADGNLYTKEEDFRTVIGPPRTVALSVEEEETKTNPWWISGLLLVIVLLAGLALWMFCLVVRSRKELADARVIREELYGEKEKG